MINSYAFAVFTVSVLLILNIVQIIESQYVPNRRSSITKYNFNHPPSAEYYNPIPVAVVYDDNVDVAGNTPSSLETKIVHNHDPIESTTVTSGIETKILDIKEPIEYVNVSSGMKTTMLENSERINSKTVNGSIKIIEKSNPVESTTVNNGISYSETKNDNILSTTTKQAYTTINPIENSQLKSSVAQSKPRSRTLSTLQIPVAVIYDNADDNPQNYPMTASTFIKQSQRKSRVHKNKQRTKTNINTFDEKIVEENYTASTSNRNLGSKSPETEDTKTNIKSRTMKYRAPIVPIVDSKNYVYGHSGNFHYSYEGGDGTKAFSKGELKSVAHEGAGESVVGGFSYTDKDGNDFSLSYTADENGYRPVGAHLPTPPPIPIAIARALKYLATVVPDEVTSRDIE